MNSKKILLASVLAVLIILVAVLGFLLIETKTPRVVSTDLSGCSDLELAKSVVLNFTGDNSTVLEYTGMEQGPQGSNNYKFTSDNGEVFYADSTTFEVWRADFPSSVEKSEDVMISLDEAESIARDFIAIKTSPAEAQKLELVEGKLLDYADLNEYSLMFNEIKENVSLYNHVSVSVDAGTGDIMAYSRLYRETLVSLVPEINADEALKIAEDQFEGFTVWKSEARLMIHSPGENEQYLGWLIRLTGKSKKSDMGGALVLIDAQTGEVLSKSVY